MTISRFLKFATCALVSLFLATFVPAQLPFDPFADDSAPTSDEPVAVTLVSESKAISAGQTFRVGWKFNHSETWHTYWLNSGSVELSFEVDEWKLPEGFKAGPVIFPVPHRLEGKDWEEKVIVHYHFEGENYYFADITAPADLAGENVEIGVNVNWQQCGIFPGEDTVVCVPKTKEFTLKLAIADQPAFDEKTQAVFDEYRKDKLPRPLAGWKVDAYKNPQGVQLVISPDGENANADPGEIHFFPEARNFVIEKMAQKIVSEDGVYVVQFQNDPESEKTPKTLKGMLWAEKGWLTGGSAPSAFVIEPVLTAGQPPVGRSSGLGEKSLAGILFAAFIGGLILNLMPCVFPVIGLKIMGFVKQAGEDRKKITLHGLIFAAGVIVSFWVLSAAFFILRAQGEKVGWGFQLQNPWFVYILILVMFILALNMAGVFEIGTSAVGVGSKLSSGHSGMTGTFFSGVLATVVATPCSAPFLGTALGAVASLTAVPFFATFTCIALGLSLPYIILSIFPDLVKKLPKPGPWMESFKQGMSFLLFATAGYLYWSLSAQSDNSLYTIISLAMIAMALWIYGRWATPIKSKSTRRKATLIMLGLFAVSVAIGHPKVDPLNWEPWSQARVDELVSEGKPVYIDFTARWCATCQTNKISYKSKAVEKLIADRGITLLKASWDKPNPAIKDAIEGYGRGAIPVNVLYIPGVDEPDVLPELLTSGVVKEYLEKVPVPES